MPRSSATPARRNCATSRRSPEATPLRLESGAAPVSSFAIGGAAIDPQEVTGLVLAGGRGSRMGGVDKGLQRFAGEPLARRALHRLAPQVGPLSVSANRHRADYEAMGVPVVVDVEAPGGGPLAGVLAGLRRCRTSWLVTVACDVPFYPLDLVARLAAALAADPNAKLAVASTLVGDRWRRQPVFCLVHASLADSLSAFLGNDGRKVEAWLAAEQAIDVRFDTSEAFVNVNTMAELRRLDGGG